jgi:hypothetical protein
MRPTKKKEIEMKIERKKKRKKGGKKKEKKRKTDFTGWNSLAGRSPSGNASTASKLNHWKTGWNLPDTALSTSCAATAPRTDA